MGWGDWNVVLAVSPTDVEEVESVSTSHGIDVIQIGQFSPGPPVVRLVADGRGTPAPRLESERFAKDSWFSQGIEGYIEKLQSLDLQV
jgi:thiamine-monophosphate kinase